MTTLAALTCPACHRVSDRARSATPDGTCSFCDGPLTFARRYGLVGERPTETGADVADGAAPLWEGVDVVTQRRVLIRLAPIGAEHAETNARLEREATVLRGLSHPAVPSLVDIVELDGVGRALVLEHPEAPSLESVLEGGLRTDTAGATRFLAGLLEVLVYLHGLSPPVFHRHLQPRAVYWSGQKDGRRTGLKLYDFARATDVVSDAVTDPVLERQGYAPTGEADPVAYDLYGAAATCVHLLTRTPLDQLPHDEEGRPRFREAANVDDHLARVLDRLLAPRARDRFRSAKEALRALERSPEVTPDRAVSGVDLRRPGAVAAGLASVVGLVGAAGFWLWSAAAPPAAPLPSPSATSPGSDAPPPTTGQPASPTDPSGPTRTSVSPTGPAVLPVPTRPPHGDPDRSPGHHEGGKRRPAPRGPSDQEVLLAALKGAVKAHRSELEACAKGDDRFRFEVAVAEGVVKATPRDRASSPSVKCAQGVLQGLKLGKAPAQRAAVEVTVYLRPSFRVTAF